MLIVTLKTLKAKCTQWPSLVSAHLTSSIHDFQLQGSSMYKTGKQNATAWPNGNVTTAVEFRNTMCIV